MSFKNIKNQFPIFDKNPELVYLDTAASAQKPKEVIDSINNCYAYEYANIHRGVYKLSTNITDKFESARAKTSKYINADSPNNIVFTKSATEAINLVAACFSEKFLDKGDEILLSYLEHHANIVPWQIAAEKKGFKIIVANVNSNGELDYKDLIKKINSKTKLISITHMSNLLGTVVDIDSIKEHAKKFNIPMLIDGCQYIAHAPVDVKGYDCDFYVYSGHKLYGPSGVGVLFMKDEWFDKFGPYQGGGSMINTVDFSKTTYAKGNQKFEAGTPPIVQVVGLGASYDFISRYDLNEIFEYEKNLYQYAVDKLKSFNDINIIGHNSQKGGILSFTIDNIHSNDIGMILDQQKIAIRTGHHCAQPLLKKFNLSATARASFGIYNTKDDVDKFVEGIKETKKFFNNA
tara:strand:- start:95 stop:1306 length:1212 start_codon:yes stop_codon:yes gene_type:complete